MAGDWIKMRVALAYDLKVTKMARIINQGAFLEQLAPDCRLENGSCNVPALQYLVVGALHKFWSAAQEITVDGVLRGFDLHDIDQMVGITGFAEAMVDVGWMQQDAANDSLIIHNFQEHNGEGAKKRAQGQKRVEKHREEKRNTVTDLKRSSVTREEKRREEENNPSRAPRSGLNGAFTAFWESYPRKKSKANAEKAWLKIKPDEQLTERILHAVEQAKTSADWQREAGRFIPHPASWLNAKGWEDEHGRVRVIPAGGSEVVV